jgi:MFS family permease
MHRDEEKPLLDQSSFKRNTWRTHFRAVLAAISCCLASGLLLGYPTIVPLVAPTGVFAQGCPNGNITNCASQGLQFQNLYNVAWSTTNVGILFVGIFFDRFGARASAVIGACLTAVGFIPLWAATMFPGRADWLLFIGFPLIQVAGMLNSMAVLGLLVRLSHNIN